MSKATKLLEKMSGNSRIDETVTLTVPPLPTAQEQERRLMILRHAGVPNVTLGANPATDINVPSEFGQKAVTALLTRGINAAIT